MIVGKATDNSGFGGAAFASLILDEKDKEANKGAVQVPDPFLKNVLIRATEAVFKEARKNGIELGYKDMGAGGIMCASSELASDAGYGADIDIDKVHISMDIPSFIIACSETQERFTWISPPEFTPRILQIYNEEFELPNVAEKAQASIIGKITKDKQYIMRYKGNVVCNSPIDEVTGGIKYKREYKEPKKNFEEPIIKEPGNYKEVLLKILKHPNICCKENIYKHYDTEVMGNAVIRPGEADAGLIQPLPGKPFGVALSVDSNPKYARISPYWGAVTAVAESMRNVAAIGAVPSGLTDCLNYGNPEKPESFWQFREGVRGVADAASKIHYKGTKEPVAVVSGNVSFYNESATGKSVDPSAIIACVGVMKDYSKAITTALKKRGNSLYLIGKRKDELGGSVYYDLHKELGKNVPKINFENERNMIHAVIDVIEQGHAHSCHDISDGGIATTIAEMCILGNKGATVIANTELRPDKFLFSETTGFVLEADEKAEKIFAKYNLDFEIIGKVSGNSLKISVNDNQLVDCSVEELKKPWYLGLKEAME